MNIQIKNKDLILYKITEIFNPNTINLNTTQLIILNYHNNIEIYLIINKINIIKEVLINHPLYRKNTLWMIMILMFQKLKLKVRFLVNLYNFNLNNKITVL